MAQVKWIKISTNIFDDEKILLIESLPDSYAIITVWFKLLCLAGKQNNSGVFMLNDKIAYTDKMLASIFRMNDLTVKMALETFERFGMIEMMDGVITIPNWEKHQSLDRMEELKAQNRIRQSNYRNKQKLLACNVTDNVTHNVTHNVTVTQSNATDKDKEKDLDIIINNNNNNYQLIADMYNDICISFPRLTVLSEKRKQAIKARLKVYTVEQFKAMFEMAEKSTFLKGGNAKNWIANFDWLVKDSNFAKVLDGNYTDKPGAGTQPPKRYGGTYL